MDEQSKKLLKDILTAFPSLSKWLAIPLIALGILFTLLYGNKGLPLFIVGLVYGLLPILRIGKPNKTVIYPALLAGAAAVFIGAITFYVAVAPNPGELFDSAYFALIGLSLALFIAGVADFSLHVSQLSIEDRISKLDQRLQEEHKLDKQESATDQEKRQAEEEHARAEQTRQIIDIVDKKLLEIRGG